LIPTGMSAGASLTYLSRDLGAILALTEGATATLIVLILVLTVLYGSDSTCERAFRLLRWVVNRPEPPSDARRETKRPRATLDPDPGHQPQSTGTK
jgi:hypothetical protein